MGKRILIFGASGRTGQVVKQAAEQAGYEVQAPSHAECPLEQAEAVSDLVLGSGALVILAPGLLAIVPAACCWLCDIVAASVFVLHLREEDRQRLEESRRKSAEDVNY